MEEQTSAGASWLRSRSPVVVLSVLLVVALVGWFTFDFLSDKLGASSCDTTTRLNVTAAADIAPVVANAARRVSDEDGCYQVTVTSRESDTTAESLVVSDGTERPDVWIPESTIWLQRAQAAGAWDVPVNGQSIASSPVVLALTEDTASLLGWPDRAPTWAQVFGPQAAEDLSIGLPDPAREPVGVSALFGVRGVLGTAPDPAAALTTTLRGLSPNTVPSTDDLFDRLPGEITAAEPLEGFPASEKSVLRHNATQAPSKLVAVYAQPAVPALDYPFVVLPDTKPDKRDAAEKFLAKLVEPETTKVLSDAGFRTPDGRSLRDRSRDKRVSAAKLTPPRLPPAAEIDTMLNQWAGANRSARIQVLVDVSGSMNEPVAGTGKTRMALTLQAAELGLGLMKPTTKVGLWLFSTNLDGPGKDYKELVPVETVSDLLSTGALEQLRSVQALPNGATGLYDSTLAAYQTARQNYEPGRINLVVVLTDGRNEDGAGISREALLTELGNLGDPRRPVQVIGIGIGPDVDVAELQAISGATGGQAFTTPDPTKINEIFYAALSTLLCQPPTCKPAG